MEFESVDIDGTDLIIADDIFIKPMRLDKAGIYVPQHSHKFDHASMVAVGSIRVWCDDVLVGDFVAPQSIIIEAGTKHTFLSLEPSLVYCIHNISRLNHVEINDEHTHVSDKILSQGV